MGTARKLLLASLVSAVMVLVFAVGLMPSTETLSAFADDGPRDIRDILDALLGRDDDGTAKGDGGILTINQPPSGATVRILQNTTRALLPVQATADVYTTTRVGVDGSVEPVSMTWTGDLASPDAPILIDPAGTVVTYVDLASVPSVIDTTLLGTTAHTMYGLADSLAKIDIMYDILDQIPFSVEVVTDLMNPFQELGDGETYLATQPGLAGGGTLYTVFQDLNVTGGLPGAKGLVDDTLNGVVSVPVIIGEGDDQLTVLVQAASLIDLRLALGGAIGLNDEAVLVVQVATTAADLVGPTEAADLDEIPSVLDFNAAFVHIAAIYTTDDGLGVAFTEVEDLPDDLPVVVKFTGLQATEPGATRGVNIWSHESDVDFTLPEGGIADVDPTAEWTMRTGSTFDAFRQCVEIYLDYLSIFAPFQSLLDLDAVIPNAGPVAGGNTVSVTGTFPIEMGGGLAEFQAKYSVFFGDADPGNEATITSVTGDGSGDTIVAFDAVVPASESLVDDTVDVSIVDNDTPSNFDILVDAYTYAGTPTIVSVDPNVVPLTPGPIMITGTNLGTVQTVSFGTAGEGTDISVNAAGTVITVTPPTVVAPQIVDITVITAGGMVTVTNGLEYVSEPAIDDFNPKEGPVEGGQEVVITGMNLTNIISVTIAGFPATVTNVGGTTLTVLTGPGADAASGPVVVVTAGGTATSEAFYTYVDEAVDEIMVDSVSPDNAWVFGGVTAVIQGSGFLGTEGKGESTLTVTFDDVAADVIDVSDDRIVVQVPAVSVGTAASETVDVVVTRGVVSDTLEETFTYHRVFEQASVVTTAQTLASGSGSVDIALNVPTTNSPPMMAQLVVPPVGGQTGTRHVLARATTVAGSFGTTPDEPNTGVNIANSYGTFDVHVYSEVDINTKGLQTTTGGMSTLMEQTDAYVFTTNAPAELSNDARLDEPAAEQRADWPGGDLHRRPG